MLNRKTITFLLLTSLMITLSITATAATDIQDNTTTVTDIDNTLDTPDATIYTADEQESNRNILKKINEEEKEAGEGSFAELNTQINENDELTLSRDYIKGDDESPITITKSVTIDGNGRTIQSDNGLFTVNQNAVLTLKNVNLVGGTGSNSALTVSGTLNIADSTFVEHHSNVVAITVNGGANVYVNSTAFSDISDKGIFYFNSNSHAEFRDSTFTNSYNTVYGGAVTIYGTRGTFTFENCTFEDNVADLRGGAIYSKANLVLKNSTFRNNRVESKIINKNQGGAVLYVEGDVYLYNNTMQDNHALTADIYNSYATFHTPVIITVGNTTCEEGSSATITATITDDNSNTIDLYAESTGISGLDDTEYITKFNLTVNNNKYNITRQQSLGGNIVRTIIPELPVGEYEIGAEYWKDELADVTVIPGTLTITEPPIYSYTKLENLINESEGTVFVDMNIRRGMTETSVIINKNITIDLNGYTWDALKGQAIEITENATVTIRNGTIINIDNEEPSFYNCYGRLARVTEGSLTLENILFTNSTATNFPNKEDNFISLENNTSLTLNNCTIKNTVGTFIDANEKTNVNINNSIFANNKLSTDYAGLIIVRGKTVIDNTEFFQNSANYAIIFAQNQKDELIINNTIFDSNTVSVGAPVYTGYATEVSNSQFLYNTATRMTARSAAIASYSSLKVFNSTFIENSLSYDYDGSIILQEGTSDDIQVWITNSILIPHGTKAAIYNKVEAQITFDANYNYWGINTTPSSYVKSSSYDEDDDYGWYSEEYDCTPVNVTYWVVINTTVKPEENHKLYDTVTVETTYNKYTDGKEYYDLEGSIPDVELCYRFSDENAEPVYLTTENSKASMKYRIEDLINTITVTDGYTTNIITINAEEAEPEKHVLNDGNWTYYFNEDGTVNEETVRAGDELQFEGEFNNRNMIITIPLNITTEDTQAQLYNSSFIVLADNVNITGLEITSSDNENPLILVDDASEVVIKDNILTQKNGDKQVTHTIEINNGQNNKVINNTITTEGPETDIEYSSYGNNIILVTTVSIQAQNSTKLIVDSNNINLISNNKTTSQGTLYGIYVTGIYEEDEDEATEYPVDNIQITNNQITTQAQQYSYAITLNHATESYIQNNTIKSESQNYADAIQTITTNTTIALNNIEINTQNRAYAVIVNGFMDYETYQVNIAESNTVTQNNITINSKNAWAIEVFIAENNTVTQNNITINASNAVAIGCGDADLTTISSNNIKINATMTDEADNGDSITSYTTGIRITTSKLQVKTADNNKVISNNITVTAPEKVPAVNSTTNNNNITDNWLVSSTLKGDKAVTDTGNGGTTENNTPVTIPKQVSINIEDLEVKTAQKTTINLTLTDEEDNIIETGNLEIILDDKTIENITIDTSDITIILPELNEGKHTLTLRYTSTDDEYLDNEKTVTIQAYRKNTTITLELVETAKTGSAVVISGNLVDEDGVDVKGNVTLTVNGEDVLVDVDGSYEYEYVFTEVGVNNVTAIFEGTDEYSGSSAFKTINITELNTKLTLDTIPETKLGSQTTITGQLTDENDKAVNTTLRVLINNGRATIKTDVDGKYSYNYTFNRIGENSITVTFEGTDTYNPSNITKTIKVTQPDTQLTLNLPETIKLQTKTEITGQLTDEYGNAIKGTIKLTINNGRATVKTDENGKYSYNYTFTKIGENNITATYQENTKYHQSTANTTITVTPLETNIMLDEIKSVKIGENVTISGVLQDELGNAFYGSVKLTVNGGRATVKTGEDGRFEYVYKSTRVGQNNITAAYLESAKHLASLNTTSVNITQASAQIILDDIKSVRLGEEVTVSGVLQDELGNAFYGSVKLTVNGGRATVKTGEDGRFVYVYKSSRVGQNNITVTYLESAKYTSATTDTTVNIQQQETILTVTTQDEVQKKQNITITGQLTDKNGNNITGTVKLLINNGRATVKTDANGVYSYVYTASKSGINNITASYLESTKYLATNSTTTFKVI